LTKDGESAIDVVGYGAQIVVQLGTHVVKMKLPTAHIEQERKVHGVHRIAISTPTECVRHVANRDFAGRRIVPLLRRPANFHDRKLLGGIRAIHAGEGFGSIIGSNSFQHPKDEAIRMLGAVMDIHSAVPQQSRAQ
jgi:class I fructose-bisphosphate aldolase